MNSTFLGHSHRIFWVLDPVDLFLLGVGWFAISVWSDEKGKSEHPTRWFWVVMFAIAVVKVMYIAWTFPVPRNA